MSTEIRVSVEIADTDTEQTVVRVQQGETVIRSGSDDVNDDIAVARAALERIGSDALSKAADQLQDVSMLVAQAQASGT